MWHNMLIMLWYKKVTLDFFWKIELVDQRTRPPATAIANPIIRRLSIIITACLVTIRNFDTLAQCTQSAKDDYN